MARFFGSINGQAATPATRTGTQGSGIRGHIRGWNIGGDVELHARGDLDTCSLLLTGGSKGERNLGVEIAAFEEEGPRIRYIVRLPGNVEIAGYVGDEAITASIVMPGGERVGLWRRG